jgi:hypothetical protein
VTRLGATDKNKITPATEAGNNITLFFFEDD